MDAAALSLNVESSKVVQAANDLDRFAASSDRAAAAAAKVKFGDQGGSLAKMVALVQSIDSKMSSLISTMAKAQQAEKAMAAANDNSASSLAKVGTAVAVADSHVIAYTQHLAGLVRAQQDANSHVVAWQNRVQAVSPALAQADSHVVAYRNSLGKVAEGANAASTAIKFTAQDTLNASRQMADIGVTLAMGMNPLMVAIQQGPQLLDILQNKAAMTGQTLGAVFKAAAASIGAALAPLLPLILLLGVAAAAIATLNAEANKDAGLKKYTTAMGYTKEEVKKLNAVTVTWGDTMKAVFQVGFERAASALGISSASMSKAWKSALNFMMTATREVVAGIYASLTGLGYAAARVYDNIKNRKFENPLSTLVEGYKSARGDAMKFMDDVVKQSQKNARARQDAMAAAMYDKPSTPKGGKSDAEKLADIISNAEAEIKAEQAKAAAVGLSARAAIELEQRTKLLNDIEKAKIPVTAAVTKEVDRLAKAYADAKIATDVAAAIQGVTDSIEKQRTSINDQTNLIGLYGDELTRARIQMEMLTAAQNALPKGVTLSTEDANRVSKAASGQADDQILQDRNRRMEAVRKDAEDAMYALDLERKGLGLTGAAAEAYAYIVDRLNDSKRAGIELSPDEVRAIEAAGAAYGQARYAIDQHAQAIADAREVAKGFFTDLLDGVRQGASAFTALGNAAVNALNRIIDKLLDKALDSFLNSMIGGGGGGFKLFANGGAFGTAQKYANGGAFDQAQRFANGGAFTNTVVNTPTLFRFAKGSKFGLMGEAGPEAVMPLSRDSNGRLGVKASGGGSPSIRMGDVYNSYQVEGGFKPEDVMAMIRRGGEATIAQMRRDLQSMLQQLDNDGGMI